MFIRNINKLSLAALFIMIGIASASSASANAGHHNVAGPDLGDAGTVRNALVSDAGTCYTEPTGFHTNIHWDTACRDAQRAQRQRQDHATDGSTRFEEPSGFHHSVQSIAKVDAEPVQEQRPSYRVAKCKWTNVHCSGM